MRRHLLRVAALAAALALLLPATAAAAPVRGITSVSAGIVDSSCSLYAVTADMTWDRQRADTATLELVSGSTVVSAESLVLAKPARSGSFSTSLSTGAPIGNPITIRATLWLGSKQVGAASTRELTCIVSLPV